MPPGSRPPSTLYLLLVVMEMEKTPVCEQGKQINRKEGKLKVPNYHIY